MADLAMIYITADPQDNGAELRCTDHPEWWADADGTDLPSAVRSAIAHFGDEHRVHVPGCVCRDRVTDGRCVPHPGIVLTGIVLTEPARGSVAVAVEAYLDEFPQDRETLTRFTGVPNPSGGGS